MKSIYIVRTINLQEKSQDELKQDFEIFKVKYSRKDDSFEKFLSFQLSWGNDKYSINWEDNAYCESFEIARDKVINNACGMDDGGAYNYAAIIKVPFNACYPLSYSSDEDVKLFKFDRDQDTFIEITEATDESKWLIRKSRGVM